MIYFRSYFNIWRDPQREGLLTPKDTLCSKTQLNKLTLSLAFQTHTHIMTAWRQASLSGGLNAWCVSASLSLTPARREGTCLTHFSVYLGACSRQMNSERAWERPLSEASAIFISVSCSLSSAEDLLHLNHEPWCFISLCGVKSPQFINRLYREHFMQQWNSCNLLALQLWLESCNSILTITILIMRALKFNYF